jgi:hypothetical protein
MATGTFSFNGIARFDLATFQAAGVARATSRSGRQPVQPCSPSVRGQLSTTPEPRQHRLAVSGGGRDERHDIGPGPDAGRRDAAPAGTQVAISFGTLTVTTDAQAGSSVSCRFPPARIP